jgi:glycosyltransferase involved in cell wall biosynthesis
VRNSNIPVSEDTVLGRFVHAINRRTSHRASAIIANSQAGRNFYCRQGFRADRFSVIKNGIDVDRFRRLEGAAREFRQRHGVSDEDFLIGLVGRVDPDKGHTDALVALSELQLRGDQVKLCFVGGGGRDSVAKLQALAADLRITDKVIWLGHVEDIVPVYSAIDTCVLPSRGEGFPNSLAEAMSCETPCIAADVGDVAELIGDTGCVIPKCSATSLAQAIAFCRCRDLRELGTRARRRIIENFSVSRMVEETTRLLERVGQRAEVPPTITEQRQF